jgi:hypothetical protein
MNQTSIIKELIIAYQLEGGNTADIAAIVVYITAKKPSGIGRVNEVIVRAVLKQLGTPAPAQPDKNMFEATPTPPAIVQAAYEKVSVDPAATYDFGEPAVPAVSYEQAKQANQPEQPFKTPEKNGTVPEAVPAEVAPAATAPKGFWNKVKSKFWK